MSFIKKYKFAVSALVIVIILVAVSSFIPKNEGEKYHSEKKAEQAPEKGTAVQEITPKTEETKPQINLEDETKEEKAEQPKHEITEKEVETQSEQTEQNVCSISINCATILNNTEKLNEAKLDFVPQNGAIFSTQNAEISSGDSVFDVLKRELQKSGIPLVFSKTPFSGGVYIEGIANLYEFDCGTSSGWMYKVNGETPNVSASDYILKPGDVVEFIYTCDMGNDI